MRSRWNLWVPGSSLLLSLTTLSWNALAQDPADPAAPAPDAAAPAAPAAPPAAPAEEDEDEEEAAAPAAASTEAAAGGQAEASAEVSVAVEPPPPAKDAGSTDSVSVVILPGSAYPEPRIRGIVGGSLWLTMPGYQFPYLPKVAGSTGVQLGLSGSVWTDTTYARFISGTPETDKSQTRWLHQTRGVARITPAYSTEEGWFVMGNGEFVANSDQTVPTGSLGLVDDLYVRAGKWNVFDITVGRFQGWEVYHYGMGLDQNTFERRGAERSNALPPQIYGLDFFWDRPTGGGGHYAAHFYPTDFLRFELMGELGTRDGQNIFAVRPVGILDFGFLKVKAGLEWGETNPQPDEAKFETSWNGVGGAIQGIFDPYVEAGINAAVGYKDNINDNGLTDLGASTTSKSFGGFINLHPPIGSLLVGAGANYTTLHSLIENQVPTSPNYGESDQKRHFQGFVAVQYSFWDRLFLKFVGGRAWYQFEDNIQDPPHPYVNGMWSGRFRIAYNF